MRLTWFGGTAVRIHIGGAMLVADAETAPGGVDRTELLSGADRTFGQGEAGRPRVDPASWRPRRPTRALDAAGPEPVAVLEIGPGVTLIDAVGEPPLLLIRGPATAAGRWASDAVVVVFEGADAEAALEAYRPRLLALAVTAGDADGIVPALRDRLEGTGLVVLEPGLALEV